MLRAKTPTDFWQFCVATSAFYLPHRHRPEWEGTAPVHSWLLTPPAPAPPVAAPCPGTPGALRLSWCLPRAARRGGGAPGHWEGAGIAPPCLTQATPEQPVDILERSSREARAGGGEVLGTCERAQLRKSLRVPSALFHLKTPVRVSRHPHRSRPRVESCSARTGEEAASTSGHGLAPLGPRPASHRPRAPPMQPVLLRWSRSGRRAGRSRAGHGKPRQSCSRQGRVAPTAL